MDATVAQKVAGTALHGVKTRESRIGPFRHVMISSPCTCRLEPASSLVQTAKSVDEDLLPPPYCHHNARNPLNSPIDASPLDSTHPMANAAGELRSLKATASVRDNCNSLPRPMDMSPLT